MTRKVAKYSEVRNEMSPGDIIAFSGKGNFSEIIKWATRAHVSHVGIILQSKLLIGDTPQQGFFNQIIESTSLNGFSGVSISRLSDRVDTYDGEMWWLPLSEKCRNKLKPKKLYDFLLHQEKKPYDLPQAAKSALDALDNIPLLGKTTHNIEDFSSFFCSIEKSPEPSEREKMPPTEHKQRKEDKHHYRLNNHAYGNNHGI